MSDKSKKRGSKRFMDAIKQGQEFSASMKAGVDANKSYHKSVKPMNPNMTSNFKKIPDYKEAASQGIGGMISGVAAPMAFRMPPFPKIAKDMDGDGDKDSDDYMAARDKAIKEAMGKGVTRIREEDGVFKRETLLPRNKMGSIVLKEEPMPMAYKHKVVKKTAAAKAIPFTAK